MKKANAKVKVKVKVKVKNEHNTDSANDSKFGSVKKVNKLPPIDLNKMTILPCRMSRHSSNVPVAVTLTSSMLRVRVINGSMSCEFGWCYTVSYSQLMNDKEKCVRVDMYKKELANQSSRKLHKEGRGVLAAYIPRASIPFFKSPKATMEVENIEYSDTAILINFK